MVDHLFLSFPELEETFNPQRVRTYTWLHEADEIAGGDISLITKLNPEYSDPYTTPVDFLYTEEGFPLASLLVMDLVKPGRELLAFVNQAGFRGLDAQINALVLNFFKTSWDDDPDLWLVRAIDRTHGNLTVALFGNDLDSYQEKLVSIFQRFSVPVFKRLLRLAYARSPAAVGILIDELVVKTRDIFQAYGISDLPIDECIPNN